MSRCRVVSNLSDAVGQTPLIPLRRLAGGSGLWAKLECTNPGGSVKDRAAANMIKTAEAQGLLRTGMEIIDSTSGNTGIALAAMGAARGYRVTLVMPSNVSTARKSMLGALGANIVYSDPLEGSDGALTMVRSMVEEKPDRYFYTAQYENEANWRAHYQGTGPELQEALQGLTHVVAGVGTSGTAVGTGRYFKDNHPEVEVIGVEPDDAFHGLEGLKHIASSIRPGIYDETAFTRTVRIDTEEGWTMSERIAHEEGLQLGHSAGAIVAAGLHLLEEERSRKGACILPDHAARYIEPRGARR